MVLGMESAIGVATAPHIDWSPDDGLCAPPPPMSCIVPFESPWWNPWNEPTMAPMPTVIIWPAQPAHPAQPTQMRAAWFCPSCNAHHAPHVDTCPKGA